MEGDEAGLLLRLADGERGIGICILGGRELPWQMTVVYAAFCSYSL